MAYFCKLVTMIAHVPNVSFKNKNNITLRNFVFMFLYRMPTSM